jgi:hypothetical protein
MQSVAQKIPLRSVWYSINWQVEDSMQPTGIQYVVIFIEQLQYLVIMWLHFESASLHNKKQGKLPRNTLPHTPQCVGPFSTGYAL